MISKDLARHFESCKRDIYEIERQISEDNIQFESPVIGKISVPMLQSLYHAQIQSYESTYMIANVNLIQNISESVIINFQKLANSLPIETGLQSDAVIREPNPNFDEKMIRSFVIRLTRAIAILGAKPVIELLDGWLNGEKISFKQYLYIHGISVTKVMKITETVEIQPFTVYQQYIKDLFGLQDFPEGALCSITRTENTPFLKLISDNFDKIGRKTSISNINNVFALCDVLSLETGYRMNAVTSWCEPGELQLFCNSIVSDRHILSDESVFFKSEDTDICAIITSKEVQHALKLQQSVNKFKINQENLKKAISCWRASMRLSRGIWDHAINLRVALEALYLSDITNTGEFGFRLASRCAWHLGANHAEREEIFIQCRNFYGIASKAVHGNNIKIKGNEVAIVAKARENCRLGILKSIFDDKVYNWNKIIIGAPK